MRIDDIVNQLLAPIQPLQAQGGRKPILGLDSQNQDSSGFSGRGRLSVPQTERTFSSTPSATVNRPAATDQADLSSLARSRSRLAAAGGRTTAPTAQDPQALGDPAAGNPDGVSIIDSYIRQRAIIAYRFPARDAYSPSVDFTLDVEVAYRRIDIVPTSQLVDTEA